MFKSAIVINFGKRRHRLYVVIAYVARSNNCKHNGE